MTLVNRLLALAFGLALAAAGALAVLIVVATALPGLQPAFLASWDATLRELRWDEPWVQRALLGLLGAGLVLLVLQLLRHPPAVMTVAGASPLRDVLISRRALERRIDWVAERDPDVAAAATRLDRRRCKVRVAVVGEDLRGARARVRDAVAGELATLRRGPRLRVRATPSQRRAR